eukprot:Phypoly_transcript_01324.p1 GENE.Phypoly_transcript_01324~~Phypoly_transcript_01324.p1  ORF type:complete len:1117 (+),score=280.10 Phypoly_transcript_01324:120-3353(+)
MSEATDTPTSDVVNKSPNGDKPDPKQEGAKDDKANGAEKDDSTGKAIIEIKNFSKIKEKKHYTESVEICGLKWRLLVFPHGNDVDNLSLYLDFVDGKSHGHGFFRDARFTLEVVSQINPRESIKRVANHKFSEESSDWGFTQFMKLNALHDPRLGYLKDDRLIVIVEVELLKEDKSGWYWNLDSKKETGYVGLKNQGATCYMNSLLQALYHVPMFRKAVYQLPTDNEVPTKSIQLALQRIFYRLQFGNTSVGTKELTKSFGWTAVDSFTQHDVQELDRVLLDNLQTKMKGTKAEGTVENLFQGKIRNFIKCVDIDFESNREETYFDLSLNVKGCADVMQSFEKYVEVEMLEGSNKYHAEGHGLQTAKKGCMFLSFPSTLHLQLKRFEYEPMRDAMVKVNDKYVFPETLDLSKFMTEDADKSSPPIFHLHGVLVHSGDVHGGHYYAFIRPTTKPDWFKFDDERVTRATIQQVTEDNFGGEEEYNYNLHGRKMTQVHKKFSNAYMLVYLRASDVAQLLSPIPDTDIPLHLKNRFEKEEVQEEVKKKEKAEAHLYMSLRVATDADLRLGRKSDLVKFDNVKEFKVKKNSTLKDFKKQAAEYFDIPPERQRYWGWVSRQNKTLRPDSFLTAHEEEIPLEEYAKHAPEVRLYLEPSTAPETSPPFPPLHDDDILVFFKHYDPSRELLHYVGHAIVRASLKPPNLIPLMNSLVGQPPNTSLLVFEEVKPNMVDICRPNLTLRELEISNGDILVFQRTPELRESAAHGLATVPEYYDYILNRVTVKFRRLDQPRKDAFTLELSKKMLYDQVTAKLAAKLGTDASKIRLTGHNSFYDTAKTTPLKRQERMTLTDMLSTYYQPTTDTLFFESLDVPVAELENKKALKVSWHAYKPDVNEPLSLLLPRDAFVSDVLQMAKGMVKLDPEHGSGKLRLMEVWTNKIHKVLQDDEPISSLNDYARLRIEEIPKEELQMDDTQKRIHVVHFHKDYGIVQPHSSPFYQVVQRDETVAKFKHRIATRLGLPDEEVAKWRFAIVSFGKPEYLQENDLVGKHEYSNTDYLGLEHQDTSTARSMHRPSEKPIKIFG